MLNHAVIEKVRAFIDDREDAWALPVEAARFVHATVLACRARRCVEIGTSYGYSGLWIGAAAAANGGSLLTIDKEQRKADIAASFFREAGLEGTITCRVGIAEQILGGLEGPVDWVLNDADKENCRRYVEILYPKLPVGGVVVTDNVNNQEIVREQFVPWVRQDKRFFSTLVTVGNGLEMSVKIG
jgi:caffeoyl-CoA O-methyltransferase